MLPSSGSNYQRKWISSQAGGNSGIVQNWPLPSNSIQAHKAHWTAYNLALNTLYKTESDKVRNHLSYTKSFWYIWYYTLCTTWRCAPLPIELHRLWNRRFDSSLSLKFENAIVCSATNTTKCAFKYSSTEFTHHSFLAAPLQDHKMSWLSMNSTRFPALSAQDTRRISFSKNPFNLRIRSDDKSSLLPVYDRILDSFG